MNNSEQSFAASFALTKKWPNIFQITQECMPMSRNNVISSEKSEITFYFLFNLPKKRKSTLNRNKNNLDELMFVL